MMVRSRSNQTGRFGGRESPRDLTKYGLLARGNSSSRVVVGLGNSDREYAATRHNAGAIAVERALGVLGLHRANGLIPIPGTRSGIVLPSGFMNESGVGVRRAVERWRPTTDGLLVVHDDLDVELGRLDVKEGGSHGGHNGLRDVIAALGTGGFRRVRIGIGRPPGRMDPAEYVLRTWSTEEREAIEFALAKATEAVLQFLAGNRIGGPLI